MQKRERDRNDDGKLIKIATGDRQISIWNKAKELNDEKMLHLIQGNGTECVDMIANDFQYHKLCLTQFLNRRVLESSTDANTDHSASFQGGLQWLFSEVDQKLFNDGFVYTVTCLKDMLCKWLK